MTARTAGIVSGGCFTLAIMGPLLGLWFAAERLHPPPALLYWAQVLSGNWSVEYGTNKEFGDLSKLADRKFQFILGMTAALVLNLATLSALIGIAFRLVKQGSPAMDVITAFDLRSSDIKVQLIERLGNRCTDDMLTLIDSAFREGDAVWRTQTLPDFLGTEGADRFLKRIQKAEASNDRAQRLQR